MKLLSKNHAKRLPVIRIQKVVLKDFKSVKHGEIVFDCGKHFVPQGTQADILGVYGQNGSGKTSLIEAISILKQLMIGYGVSGFYSGCIASKAPYAQLEFTFDLQYEDGRRRKVIYSFKLERVKRTDVKKKKPSDIMTMEDYMENLADNIIETDYQIRIFDEMIQMAGDFYGETIKLQPVIDTSSGEVKNPFLPVSKRKFFLGTETDEILMDQSVNKRMASKSSMSYVFMDETIKSFLKLSRRSEYTEVITELRLYALKNLFVIDTQFMGAMDFVLPLYSDNAGENGSYSILSGVLMEDDDIDEKEEIDRALEVGGAPTVIPMMGTFVLDNPAFDRISKQFESINIVIGQLIPGMQIRIKPLSDAITKTGRAGTVTELITVRDGEEMPLRYESDGVKKIISVLDLIIKAYNQKSTTIAIDEFDSGIFEYLLGEILEVFQEGGRGQFVFTSHNLRPLEVIDKKYLYFTTTNAENRYVRLKNVGKTNNLRNVYYREIVIGEQDEELYRNTQRYKIAAAFRKAGRTNG